LSGYSCAPAKLLKNLIFRKNPGLPWKTKWFDHC